MILTLLSGLALAEAGGPARVIDGDTIEVGGRRYRLYAIDAPELDQLCRWRGKTIRCGVIAKTALMDLVAGATVSCRPRAESAAEPVVASCAADGFDLSENMVYTGWALADRGVSDRFVATEERSREARRGLWRGDFVPPWEWRRGTRLETTSE